MEPWIYSGSSTLPAYSQVLSGLFGAHWRKRITNSECDIHPFQYLIRLVPNRYLPR
jgi:hypothetical protein